jgi:hypothetical protein
VSAGDILLVSKGQDKWGRIIRWVTRSPYHHAAIDLGDGTAASAEAPRVKIKPISDFASVQSLTIGTDEQRKLVAWHALQMVGMRYSRLGFVLAGLHALGLIPGILQQPLADLADETGVTCGSMVDACYLAVGIDLLPGPSGLTWPGELAQLLPSDDPERHMHFEILPDGRQWLGFLQGHQGADFVGQEES